MGNQGQNMFTILLSSMEFLFFEKSVRMIYFLVIKHLNMSANFKIGFYVYTEKKYTCVIKRYEYMLHFIALLVVYCKLKIENQRGKMS